MATIDVITVADPQAAVVASSVKPFAAEAPSSEHPVEPLHLIDRPQARTALRLYAILSALYVTYSTREHLSKTILLTILCSSVSSSLLSIKQLLRYQFPQYALICIPRRVTYGLVAPTS